MANHKAMKTKSIPCFLLEVTDQIAQYLRRYTTAGGECGHAANGGYHQNSVFIGHATDDGVNSVNVTLDFSVPRNDPRWPSHCKCGYAFDDLTKDQLFPQALYKRSDTGELTELRSAPAGAMWYATWMEDSPNYCGSDGKCLCVQTPGGLWMVDTKAKNCTMPDDTVHRCWVRHGVVPNITVDKQGNTCAAGAGSISQPNYHGFLRNGVLEEC